MQIESKATVPDAGSPGCRDNRIEEMDKKRILVTGAAGFIGSATAAALAAEGCHVVGIDNLNSYYDPRLKLARLHRDGFQFSQQWPYVKAIPASGSLREEVEYPDIPEGERLCSKDYADYSFLRIDIADREALCRLWEEENGFDICVNMAAQAGVRYSLENPHSYVESNLSGFVNLLECARRHGCGHMIYASSSSVYGANAKVPFSESDIVDSPVSLYAATKRSDELIASVYASLYGIPLTGLRFFTVYGPWGRPDMAPMLFSDAILSGRTISLFNGGKMSRDFTYIDDIVEGVLRVVAGDPPSAGAEIFNIGHGDPTDLMRFISCLEKALGQKAVCEMAPMQPGDVERTWADTSKLASRYGYRPRIGVEEGTKRFASWRLSFQYFL